MSDTTPREADTNQVEDLGESTVVAGGRCYQLGTYPGSADVHVRKGYMILRCEAEYVMENKDGAITFGLNGDDIAQLLEVLARSGNLPDLLVEPTEEMVGMAVLAEISRRRLVLVTDKMDCGLPYDVDALARILGRAALAAAQPEKKEG